ncbi:MAG: UPF0147 family protein [Candidatus Micrarchaeota archaeon]
MDLKQKLKEMAELMDPVISDSTVPRNIRAVLTEAKAKITRGEEDRGVQIASAIYLLDDISNDINMPFHTRTDIWNIISELEKLKEEIK